MLKSTLKKYTGPRELWKEVKLISSIVFGVLKRLDQKNILK
jgi:hypothetical protein